MTRALFRLIPITLLAGCAGYQTALPLPANHPADPTASESAEPPARSTLAMDAATRETRAQLAAAKHGQQNANDHENH